ncbi:B3/B4 domain-containing protein [Phytohabitans rumicis]|uniref:B3/B4 tRNA-binding domain-containing protein n=1 Tax=Phytohabitans rumicis TaxID=1076125 RepID=A0A6V8L268_9ACTN|nr:phenylalanine--tRNA ligase beta subunit-related protein [Phytohabitans rumicis]GFJ89650.1 hypothetical protein Prum_032920 [Phytohabitans rumicis]
MTQQDDRWLAGAYVDPEVYTLRPDYRALLILADDLVPGPSDDASEKLLRSAEERAVPDHPHVEAWRDAFRAFGAKPQRTRPSVDALLRRVPQGLPRVDRLTDAYNAISVEHAIPIGGEDVDRYHGPLRLVRANGSEPFDTIVDGQPAVEHPAAGEMVWRDDDGVTCRRWNWRQCLRTRIGSTTTRAVFVLDALAPMTDAALAAAGDALAEALRATSPGVRLTPRTLGAGPG